jgi:hypothetical protein
MGVFLINAQHILRIGSWSEVVTGQDLGVSIELDILYFTSVRVAVNRQCTASRTRNLFFC